nr:hypothetical protein [Tanacetum cinerariifolium]
MKTLLHQVMKDWIKPMIGFKSSSLSLNFMLDIEDLKQIDTDNLEEMDLKWSSAPIIEEWKLDSEYENVFEPKEVKKTVKPSLEKIEFVNDQGIFYSGCFKHMTWNKSYLTNYQEIDGGFVAFGGNAKGGQAIKKIVPGPQYVLLPLLTTDYQGLKSSEDEVADDAGKKSTKVPRKEEGVQDPAKEGDKDDQQKDVRDQEEASRKQFEQESERLFGQGEATSTKSTNRLNIVSSPVNAEANDKRKFTPVSAAGSTYVYLGGSILVNAAALPNDDLPIDLLMLDLEETADTGIFSGAYDDEVEGAEADFNNLKLTIVV